MKLKILKKGKNTFLFVILVFFTILTRFYKIDWGTGIFFHPDERNIVSVTTSIKFPVSREFFLRGTFSYGSLTSYLAFWVNEFRLRFLPFFFRQDNFSFIVFFLRFFSAICSGLTVWVIYKIGRRFWGHSVGILSAILCIFSPGLIQAAHFGTFESILTFLFVLCFYYYLFYYKTHQLKYFLVALFCLVVASAIKINSIVLFPLMGIFFLLEKNVKSSYRKKILILLLAAPVCGTLILAFSPYYLTSNFRSMLFYEQSVVNGALDVFYTRQFINQSVIFPFIRILPWAINPLITALIPLLAGLFLWKKSKKEILLWGFILALFVPNLFLYTKWSRYFIPLIPFLLLATSNLWKNRLLGRFGKKVFLVTVLSVSIFWGTAFMNIYLNKDSRIMASEWIYQNIPSGSIILSETANVIDIPVYLKKQPINKNYQITNFDFYNLDYNHQLISQLADGLKKSDYIFIPSRRLFAGMGKSLERYPLVFHYYSLLFSGKLGFEKIKEISLYPGLLGIDFPDEQAEETWSVFDHPVIRIYKKTVNLSKEDYEKLFSEI